jgi:FkbM family methyltransferase
MKFRLIRKLINYTKLLLWRNIRLKNIKYKIRTLKFDQLTIQASNPEYEPETVSLYERELQRNDGYFVDVGANYGQTLLALLDVDDEIPYLGIEPQPDCVATILSFLNNNTLSNHRIICACVSNSETITHLEFGQEGDVRASIISDFRPRDTFGFKTPTVTMSGDKLIDALGIERIQFIKIDVEGAECEVLESFRNTIMRHQPVVTFELLPDVLVSTGARLPDDVLATRRARERELESFFKSIDYVSNLLTATDEVSCEIGPDPKLGIRNYVSRPKKQ